MRSNSSTPRPCLSFIWCRWMERCVWSTALHTKESWRQRRTRGVMSGSDLCSTRNVDSDRRPKQSQTSEDYRERRGNRGTDPSWCWQGCPQLYLQITRSHGKWIMTQLPSFYWYHFYLIWLRFEGVTTCTGNPKTRQGIQRQGGEQRPREGIPNFSMANNYTCHIGIPYEVACSLEDRLQKQLLLAIHKRLEKPKIYMRARQAVWYQMKGVMRWILIGRREWRNSHFNCKI